MTSKFEITTDKIAYLNTRANILPFLTFDQNHLSVVTQNKESLKAYDSIKEDYRRGKERQQNSEIPEYNREPPGQGKVRELELINEKHTEI